MQDSWRNVSEAKVFPVLVVIKNFKKIFLISITIFQSVMQTYE